MRAVLRSVAALIAASATPATPVHAVYEPIHDDGFDCRAWFTDADGDGFGAPGTGVLTCTPGPGRAPRADDCDDGTAAVNPLASDRPDALFVDANCDGADGDAARAIHVALTGIDAAGCGDRDAPCRTPSFALGRRSAARPDVYLQQGTYAGPLVMPAPGFGGSAGLYGRFLGDWSRAPAAVTRIAGAQSTSVAANTVGVIVDGGSVELGGLEIAAPAAAGQGGDGTGRGAFAVISRSAQVVAFDLDLSAGAGAAGRPGSPGSGSAGAAPTGADGGTGSTAGVCSELPGGIGGSGADHQCPSGATDPDGGAGGRGGAADTECNPPLNFDFTPRAGADGIDAALVFGIQGVGGPGGASCAGGTQGNPGRDGSSGAAGGGGNGGQIVSGAPFRYWSARSGTNGTLGTDAGGGGGGGGAGGCDAVGLTMNVRGPGGGGGGAGGCRAAQAGTAGAGGGASVGWFVDGGSLSLTGSRVVTAGGGRGGNGGAGAVGQPGGPGGQGGPSAATSGSTGGDGGAGGRGGAAGGGGGGAGGLSAGVVARAPSPLVTGTVFQVGPGGAGGVGGALAGSPTGVDGGSGGSLSVRVCASDSVC